MGKYTNTREKVPEKACNEATGANNGNSLPQPFEKVVGGKECEFSIQPTPCELFKYFTDVHL